MVTLQLTDSTARYLRTILETEQKRVQREWSKHHAKHNQPMVDLYAVKYTHVVDLIVSVENQLDNTGMV